MSAITSFPEHLGIQVAFCLLNWTYCLLRQNDGSVGKDHEESDLGKAEDSVGHVGGAKGSRAPCGGGLVTHRFNKDFRARCV